jgi:hypothetical protein
MRSKILTLALTLSLLGFASEAFAQGRAPFPEGSIFWQEPGLAQAHPVSPPMVPHGGTMMQRDAHASPLDPLDAPDAGNVWKPSNRDAGNLAAQRWTAYDERRQNLAAAPAEPRPSKSDPAHRYPAYDSFGDFFAHVFH